MNIEKAPNWVSIFKANFDVLFPDDKTKIKPLMDLANHVDLQNEYLYWDKIKYVGLPTGFKPELLWTLLKLSRRAKIINIKLASKDGQNFGYWIPDSVLRTLSFIDKTAGSFFTQEEMIKLEPKRFLLNSLMEEAIASSQLEGASTTRKVAKDMLRTGRRPINHAEKMIYNNYQTILKIKELTNRPLSEGLILELHASITQNTMEKDDWSGRFRTSNDEPIVVGDREGTLYVPPEPDKIPTMMKLLCEYANESETERFIHPVIKAIILHFYLSYIHPFNDGNGRTARALFYWYLLNKKYWLFEYLAISRMIIKAPAQYARSFLYTEEDDLDLTYFLSFNLRIISDAIKSCIEYANRKMEGMKKINFYLKKYPDLNVRQKQLLKSIMDNTEAECTLAVHQKLNGVTYETARRDLLSLEEKKLVEKKKIGRKFIFVPSITLQEQFQNTGG